MAATLINPEDWKAGNPIYYALALGNDVYTVLNAGHGYSYNINTGYALTSPAHNVLRFEVRSGDQNWFDASRSNAERSEIASNELIRPDVPVNISYGFSLEPGERNTATDKNGGWFAVGQLIQDVSEGQAGAPPAMSINMVGEKMTIFVRYRDATGNVVASPIYQDSNDIQRGHEYDIDVKAVFASDGTGRLVVVRDGVTLVDYAGRMGYTDTKGVYWKEGIYRSAASETVAATYSDLQISHGDMVKIPAQGTPYAEAAAAPTLVLSQTSKLSSGKLDASLTGTATAGSAVQIYNGEKLVGSTTADANGKFAITINGVDAGTNVFTATATGANKQISKVSGEVVAEVGTAASILTNLGLLSHKEDLQGIYLIDAHVLTVSSLAQMRSIVANEQASLSKIVGDYSFQFWSGVEGNRTLSRYDESGVFTGSYTSALKNGVLVSETYVNAANDAVYAKQVYQYNITGKTYVSSYQAFDGEGRQIYGTTTYANGKLASISQLDNKGTSTVKAFDTAGLLTSTTVKLSDGTTTSTSYDGNGRLKAVGITYPDKSSDVKFYTNGVLASEQITHAAGEAIAKEVILYNVTNATYVTVHQNFSSTNQLLSEFRIRNDGSLDTLTWLASDGTTRSKTYDANNKLSVDKVTLLDKSTDTKTYKDGIIQRETIVKTDGTKEVYDFNVINRPYGTIHTSYDAKGKVVGIEYLTPKEIQLNYAPALPAGSEPAPTLVLVGGGTVGLPGFARTMSQGNLDGSHSSLVDGKLTAALTGTAAAGSTILIYDNGKLLKTAFADSSGTYKLDVKGLTAGTHVLTASTLSAGGKTSVESDTVAVQVTTTADFLTNIRTINGTKNLEGVWLTDGNVLTLAVGQLPKLLATYGKAMAAIQGDHTFEVWSGLPGSRTVSRYDKAGTLFEKETQIETNGVLIRKVVEHVGATDLTKEVFNFQISGKEYVSTYQGYDAAGNLVSGTSTRADGSLASSSTANDAGGITTKNYDANGHVKSTLATARDGSTITTTFDANDKVASWIDTGADGSVHSKMFANGVLTNEVIVHAKGGDPAAVREVHLYAVENQSYVSSHSTFDASGKMTASERLHADGSTDWTFKLGPDGTATTSIFDSVGKLVETRVVNATGSIASETFRFDLPDSRYLSEHKGFDAAGRLILTGNQFADGGHDLKLLAPGLTVVSTTKNDVFDSYGGDTFKFQKGFGQDSIIDFQAGTGSRHDTLVFEKGMFSNDNALAAARDVGDDVVITTLQNDSVTLHGIHKAALVSVDFLIV